MRREVPMKMFCKYYISTFLKQNISLEPRSYSGVVDRDFYLETTGSSGALEYTFIYFRENFHPTMCCKFTLSNGNRHIQTNMLLLLIKYDINNRDLTLIWLTMNSHKEIRHNWRVHKYFLGGFSIWKIMPECLYIINVMQQKIT